MERLDLEKLHEPEFVEGGIDAQTRIGSRTEDKTSQLNKKNKKTKTSKRRKKANDKQIEKTLNTVVIVAVLIATLAFAALFTAPGGLQSSGEDEGSAFKIHTTPFKVFFVSNAVALFCSLTLVLLFASIIPLTYAAKEHYGSLALGCLVLQSCAQL